MKMHDPIPVADMLGTYVQRGDTFHWRKPMDWETAATHYPKLLRAMKWVALLSDTEAIACLRDYAQGNEYSSEAVCHYGGATAVVKRAYQKRHVVADWYAKYPETYSG